jgi:hypothetical protein
MKNKIQGTKIQISSEVPTLAKRTAALTIRSAMSMLYISYYPLSSIVCRKQGTENPCVHHIKYMAEFNIFVLCIF